MHKRKLKKDGGHWLLINESGKGYIGILRKRLPTTSNRARYEFSTVVTESGKPLRKSFETFSDARRYCINEFKGRPVREHLR